METFFERLAAGIGYPPEAVRKDGESHVLVVDGSEIRVEECGSRGIFRCRLFSAEEKGSGDLLPRLSEYAAGRLLKEEAVLAWDESRQEVFLWQSVPATAGARELRQVFELFLTSCDWWRSRVEEENVRENAPAFREIFIRP